MCGIVAGVSQQDIVDLLLDGLRRLEYRGYDSAGVAVLNETGRIERIRTCGKVSVLANALDKTPLKGAIGVAHTRWATHGKPSERNAHPHMSGEGMAIVHNGIIENYEPLRVELSGKGFVFESDTDTEVIIHCLHWYYQETNDILMALQATLQRLEGAYALALLFVGAPHQLYGARRGAPLVIGIGDHAHYIASDPLALISHVENFVFLSDGDIAVLEKDRFDIYDQSGAIVSREVRHIPCSIENVNLGHYQHYMQKEIFEQPLAVSEALEGRLGETQVSDAVFGTEATALFDRTKAVYIVACGTSYHAGLIARYWLEDLGVPCQVEIASEFRYRRPVIAADTLLVTISQSGETADTLAALREQRALFIGTLTICNVPESTLVRESNLAFLTHAGPEIGVASTKAFTTQLAALLLFGIVLGKRYGLSPQEAAIRVQQLRTLPDLVKKTLELDSAIAALAKDFTNYPHALFLGRGSLYPVAMEGALKLKEISYIHAQAYPAGELKHGPLALIDVQMPVVVVVPNDAILAKLKSNLQEVQARGGRLYLFVDERLSLDDLSSNILPVPAVDPLLAPILYTIPLQLLAYHVAVLKGTDVDQPRNLAKSVTVE